jgi:hypothetical protein
MPQPQESFLRQIVPEFPEWDHRRKPHTFSPGSSRTMPWLAALNQTDETRD